MISPFLGSIVIAAILVAIFSMVFKVRGPWGSVWTFFLVVFLGVWAFSLWARPIEMYFWGSQWLPALIAGILLAFLLASIVPETDASTDPKRGAAVERTLPEERKAGAAMGAFFWVLLILLAIVILVGLI